jgi:hypothetical protein
MVRSRGLFTLASVVAVVALALLAAGCGGGGGSSPGVASIAPTTAATTTTPQSGAVAFANCMRSHGLAGWPDPTGAGVFDKTKLRQLGYSVTEVRAVEDGPCNHLLPAVSGPPPPTEQQTRTQVADALSFARCMRGHGVAGFPDPTAQGRLTLEMVQAQGIDVHSAAVLRAVQECLPASHGALTPAKVREALANAGH